MPATPYIRRIFSPIAARYDLLNHVLSLNIDRLWRRRLVSRAAVQPGERVLDLCIGTGDVALEFAKRSSAALICGLDCTPAMLDVAREKLARRGCGGQVPVIAGDALAMPLPAGSFDVVAIAFGLRNLPDRAAAMEEMARLLRPGGRLLVLELSPPPMGVFGAAYRLYLTRVIPAVGAALAGSWDAYRYLASSVSHFMEPQEVMSLMSSAGLRDVSAERLTLGIAHIFVGHVP